METDADLVNDFEVSETTTPTKEEQEQVQNIKDIKSVERPVLINESEEDKSVETDIELLDANLIDNDSAELTVTGPRYNLRPEVKVPSRYEGTIEPLRTQKEAIQLLRTIKAFVLKKRYLYKMANGGKGFRSYREALKSNPNWKNSYEKELRKLENRGGLRVIKRETWMECLPFLEVLKEKVDNVTGEEVLKVRLAIRGDLQKDKPENCYSPTLDQRSIRVSCVGFRSKNCYCSFCDCPGAYLNSRLEKPIYLYLPQGHPDRRDDNYYVYECPSAVYGLAISGQVWYVKFKRTAEKFGFKKCKRNPCMFVKKEGKYRTWLILYVDDFIFGSTERRLVQECEAFFKREFDIKSTKEISKFVGIEIDFTSKGFFLHQEGMLNKLQEIYEIIPKYETPMIQNLKWDKTSSKLKDVSKLQKLFGEANYIAQSTRPDICFSLNMVARMLQQGTKQVHRACKRIIDYAVNTSGLGIEVEKYSADEKDWKLDLYTDSSFADVEDEKYKSTGAYVLLFNNTPVDWKTKKLKWVCTNSGQAEYLALYFGVTQALETAYLIEEFYGCSLFPTNVFCDNMAVIETLTKGVPTDLNRNLATKYFNVVQHCEEGLIHVSYVPSKDNIADMLTKPLGKPLFIKLRNVILQERGNVQDNTVTDTVEVPDKASGHKEDTRRVIKGQGEVVRLKGDGQKEVEYSK